MRWWYWPSPSSSMLRLIILLIIFFNISFISSKSGCSGQGWTFHNCFSYPHYSSSILSNNSTGLEYVTTNQGYRAKFLIHDNSPQIPFYFLQIHDNSHWWISYLKIILFMHSILIIYAICYFSHFVIHAQDDNHSHNFCAKFEKASLLMISIIVAIPANKNENSHHWWWSSPSYRPFCLGSVPDRALAEKEPQRANKTGPTTCHHQHLR